MVSHILQWIISQQIGSMACPEIPVTPGCIGLKPVLSIDLIDKTGKGSRAMMLESTSKL